MIFRLTKNHHLHLLLPFIYFFFFVLTFQETLSQDPPGKLGYGDKCTPHQKSKRSLASPQNIISLENSDSIHIHRLSSFSDQQHQQEHLIGDTNSMNPNNKEISSGFKRNQLRKKLRGIMERAKRQVEEADKKLMNNMESTIETTTERSTTGDNELSTSTATTTTTLMMSSSDDDMSTSRSNNSPSLADTTSTIKSLVVETGAPSSSFLPSSTLSTFIVTEESITTSPKSIEPILEQKTSSTSLPSSFMSSSHQPDDDDDNSRRGQEDESKASSLITSESDSAMRVSITTSRTDEIVSSTLAPADIVDTTTMAVTMTATTAADQELEKVSGTTTPLVPSDTSESIPQITTVNDSSSIPPVEVTSTSGSGEMATTTSMPTSMSKDESFESSTTSSSASFVSSQGGAGSTTDPVQMLTTSTTEEMTAQKMLVTTDGPESSAMKSTSDKPEESVVQNESVGIDAANSHVEGTTSIPYEDKSIVNNPPRASSTEGDSRTDVTQKDQSIVNSEEAALSSVIGNNTETTTPVAVMTSTIAPIGTPDNAQVDAKSVSSLEKPSEEEASSAAATPEAATTTTGSTTGVSSSPDIPVETPGTTLMTSATETATQKATEVSTTPAPQEPATTMLTTIVTTQAPVQTTVEMTSSSSTVSTSTQPPKAETTTPPTSTPASTSTTIAATKAAATMSESPPPTPHTSEVSSPSGQCDSSLSLECSSEAPHVCVCSSGLTWNEETKKCSPSASSQLNRTCSGDSTCSVSAFLVCRDSFCRCEDDTYQRWEESLGSCVSTAGTKSKCSLKEDSLGRQLGCVAHATCRRQEGSTTAVGQDEEVGFCECNEGFENNWMGICNNSGNSLGVFKGIWVAVLLSSFLIHTWHH